VKNFVRQGWLSRVGLSCIIAGLFTVTIFTPEINSGAVLSRYPDYYTTNIRGSQAAFSASPECVYITEPANSNFAKIPDSTPNIVPLDSAFFGFNTAGFQQGKWVCLSNSARRRSFGQLCLLLDIPPPAV
jgi:hypothetical protein